MLLLTELTSALDDKNIGMEYCQNICEKVSPIPMSILHMKSILDTCIDTRKVSPILLVAIPIQYCDINNPDSILSIKYLTSSVVTSVDNALWSLLSVDFELCVRMVLRGGAIYDRYICKKFPGCNSAKFTEIG